MTHLVFQIHFLKKALSMYDTHFLKLELFDDDDDDDDFSQQEVG